MGQKLSRCYIAHSEGAHCATSYVIFRYTRPLIIAHEIVYCTSWIIHVNNLYSGVPEQWFGGKRDGGIH